MNSRLIDFQRLLRPRTTTLVARKWMAGTNKNWSKKNSGVQEDVNAKFPNINSMWKQRSFFVHNSTTEAIAKILLGGMLVANACWFFDFFFTQRVMKKKWSRLPLDYNGE